MRDKMRNIYHVTLIATRQPVDERMQMAVTERYVLSYSAEEAEDDAHELMGHLFLREDGWNNRSYVITEATDDCVSIVEDWMADRE